MSAHGRLRLVDMLLLLVNLVLIAGQGSFGKLAANDQQGFSLLSILLNHWYIAALACMGVQAVLWPAILKRLPLGVAYGVLSLQYVNALLIGHWFFHEEITRANMVGGALIASGVILWARGGGSAS